MTGAWSNPLERLASAGSGEIIQARVSFTRLGGSPEHAREYAVTIDEMMFQGGAHVGDDQQSEGVADPAMGLDDQFKQGLVLGSLTVGFMAESGRAESSTETVGRFSCGKAAK